MAFNSEYPPERRLIDILRALDFPGLAPEFELGGMLIGLSESVTRGVDIEKLPSYLEFERRLQRYVAEIRAKGEKEVREWDRQCFEPGRAIYGDPKKHWWFWLTEKTDSLP